MTSTAGSLFARLAGLPLLVESHALEPLAQHTSAGWTRHTTVVHLRGGGHGGVGEDVTYAETDQRSFQAAGAALPLAGRFSLAEFSRHLDDLELFATPPVAPEQQMYRRWAFESAALDLALRQAGQSLAEVLGRTPRPVHYVVSLGLGQPPSIAPIQRVRALYPAMEFKVDLAADWTAALVEDLAAAGCVRTVDLKGHYRGAFQGPPADPAQYRVIAERLTEAWIEDPQLDANTEPALASARERIAWDAIIHAVADIESLPFRPARINIKPSRFGTLSGLLAAYEHCEAQGIGMYGGGQFELGPGRAQNQYLASLFHAEGPNDVAPAAFNDAMLQPGLPTSPLPPSASPTGFRWG